MCVILPFLAPGPLLQRRVVLKQVAPVHKQRFNMLPVLCSDAALCASPFCPSLPITVPSLCHLHPLVEQLCRISKAHVDSQVYGEVSCGTGATIRDLGCF